MIAADGFGPRSRDLAQRFLQTAVVVDDEAHMTRNGTDGPRAEVVAPEPPHAAIELSTILVRTVAGQCTP